MVLIKLINGFNPQESEPDETFEGFEEGSSVRDYIVRAYANIFEYQIWNVNTGRSVIENVFSSQLKPFFYLWHIVPAIKGFENEIRHARLTICYVALLNAVYYSEMFSSPRMRFSADYQFFDETSHQWLGEGFRRFDLEEFQRFGIEREDRVGEMFDEKSGKCSVDTEGDDDDCDESVSFPARFRRKIEDLVDKLFNVKCGECSVDTESDDKSIASLRSTTIRDFDVSYLITNTPVECYNHICKWTNVSKNGKWLAMRDRSKIKLFKKVNEAGNGKAKKETVFHDIQEHDIERVHSHAFTNDSFVFVYVTLSPSQNLYALSLQTGTKLCSVSRLYPVCCASEEGKGIGYIFRDA
jgi:hypothetical protein